MVDDLRRCSTSSKKLGSPTTWVEFIGSLDLVYATGDHSPNLIQERDESWPSDTIEPEFHELMFEGTHNDE